MATQAIVTRELGPSAEAIEKVLVGGNLAPLTPEQRVSYYNATCRSLGLNPLTRPFDYINLNGKLVLYAKRDCTDQLRKVHAVSITSLTKEKIDDIFIVTAVATDGQGRTDTATGAVNVKGLAGENLANAAMKAETKAKRRVTLSLCGLGLLDESETGVPAEDPDSPSRVEQPQRMAAPPAQLPKE